MLPLSSHERISELGFPPMFPVATLHSITQLFGSTKSRCGIYLLAFPQNRFYVGQAVEVVRRFAQHRKSHDEIIGFSFIPTPRTNLDELERSLIHKADEIGLVILNTVHASNVVGDTDLDLVISQEEQAAWLSSPTEFNSNHATSPIALPQAQLERFSGKFRRFQKHPLFASASQLLRTYLSNCVPYPRQTEYSFWVVSCLPATNRNTWPRLLCVSAGVMELLVIGYHKDAPANMWGFINVASDVLSEAFATDEDIYAAFPTIEIFRRQYRDAGLHQVTLHASDELSMKAVLEHNTVRQAAATLALRVMRKRGTIYAKFHCKHLADLALGANG